VTLCVRLYEYFSDVFHALFANGLKNSFTCARATQQAYRQTLAVHTAIVWRELFTQRLGNTHRKGERKNF